VSQEKHREFALRSSLGGGRFTAETCGDVSAGEGGVSPLSKETGERSVRGRSGELIACRGETRAKNRLPGLLEYQPPPGDSNVLGRRKSKQNAIKLAARKRGKNRPAPKKKGSGDTARNKLAGKEEKIRKERR